MSYKNKQYDLYLAGGMRGYPDLNRPLFMKVTKLLRDQGYSVWNPAEHGSYLESSYAECMIMDLKAIINQCSAIALLPGWRSSLGANTEALVAFVCGKSCFEVVIDELVTKVELISVSLNNMRLSYSLVGRSRKMEI